MDGRFLILAIKDDRKNIILDGVSADGSRCAESA